MRVQDARVAHHPHAGHHLRRHVHDTLRAKRRDCALISDVRLARGVVLAKVLSSLLVRRPDEDSRWLAHARYSVQKRATEIWFLSYGVFWILCFTLIVGSGVYAWFDEYHYMLVCGGLAAPLYVQPALLPGITREGHLPLLSRR